MTESHLLSPASSLAHDIECLPSFNTQLMYVASEVMLIKCYDSVEDGRARFTAHSSFEGPSSPDDAPARESIEVRTLVLFKD